MPPLGEARSDLHIMGDLTGALGLAPRTVIVPHGLLELNVNSLILGAWW